MRQELPLTPPTESEPLPTKSRVTRDLAWGRGFWAAVALVSGLLISLWILVPWQWSPVDDPGQVLAMRDLIAIHGYFGALVERTTELAKGDFTSGVFRPVAWVYPPLFYWMPVIPAHVIRLILLLIIIIGPLAYFRRTGAGKARLIVTFFVLLVAAASLYQGLVLLSIQEVGGMAFVSLGLLLPNRYARLISWTLAAWFKGPFAWILIGYAAYLWTQGRKRLSITSAIIGITTLLINVWWASTGSYTSRYQLNPLDPELWKNASRILEPFNGAILLAVLWWLVVTQTAPRFRRDFLIFSIAAFGYYLQMIPWGFTAYYMGPISFLLTLMILSTLTDPPTPLRTSQAVIALSLPALLAVWILKGSISWVLHTNEVMSQASSCLATTKAATVGVTGNWTYVTSSEEGPFRLAQNTRLFYAGWDGTAYLALNDDDALPDTTTHILFINQSPPSEGLAGVAVCATPKVVLIERSETS